MLLQHLRVKFVCVCSASLVAQMVKSLPAMRDTWVWSLCWEDPLEKEMATHSSILAWRIPMDRGGWQATVHGVTQCVFSRVWLFKTLWTIAYQAPRSMGFPRQEYWNGLSFPPPGDLPDPEIEPLSPILEGGFFTTQTPGKPPELNDDLQMCFSLGFALKWETFSMNFRTKNLQQTSSLKIGEVTLWHLNAYGVWDLAFMEVTNWLS